MRAALYLLAARVSDAGMLRVRAVTVAVALVALSCATSAPRSSPAVEPPLPLPRSSIAAVLASRGELGMSEQQVSALEELDAKLERTDAPLREELRAHHEAKKGPARPEGRGGQGMPGGGMQGGGMGRGLGRGGGSQGGGRMRPEGPAGEAFDPGAVHQKLDDNDTAAYLEAEQVLSEAQRPRAREIASRYREQVFERRRKPE